SAPSPPASGCRSSRRAPSPAASLGSASGLGGLAGRSLAQAAARKLATKVAAENECRVSRWWAVIARECSLHLRPELMQKPVEEQVEARGDQQPQAVCCG